MFRESTCPSSGGQIVLSQRQDNTICPPEDEHVDA
jgi:hypothetical protein